MAKEEKKDDYFIRIEDPAMTRRTILENTREVIRILKDYEEFKNIRAQRTELVNKFKSSTSEVRMLVQQMRKMLPKPATRVAVRRETVSAPVAPEKSTRELRRLEQELADIESKLSEI